eukprot:EG_transcript_8927
MSGPGMQWRRLLPVLAIQFSESFSTMVVNALMPFIVAAFLPDVPNSRIGYYCGTMSSALFLGQLLSSPMWGFAADRIGHKPCLLLGQAGLLCSLIAFAASPRYEWAVAARFAGGFLNGNGVICKAYIPEICVITGQVALAMGLLSLQWSLGSIFGPFIGGALAEPATKYPTVFGGIPLLEQYPFALSLATPILLAFFIFNMAVLLLPGGKVSDESDPLAKDGLGPRSPMMQKSAKLRLGAVVPCVALFTAIGMLTSAFIAVFPLYLASDPDVGGYGLNSSQVGLLLSLSGCLQLVWQPVIFPMLSSAFGFRPLCAAGFLGYGTVLFCVPFTGALPNVPHSRWLAMVGLCIVGNASTATCFSSLAVMVSFSCPANFRGRVNGIAATVSSAARVFCPTAATMAYAWSIGTGTHWPLDVHFVFHLLGIFGWTAAVVATMVPESVERPYLTPAVARLSIMSE